MCDSCEICGSTDVLKVVSVKPTRYSKKVFSSTICGKCYKKYKPYRFRYFYAEKSVAENIVMEYKSRNEMSLGSNIKSYKKERNTVMKVTYNGFTGELVKQGGDVRWIKRINQ